MIIDSHCHLEYEPMVSNLKEVVDRALKNDVKYLLSISTTDESYDKILKIVDTYKNIYGTYGIHPHETKNYVSLSSNQIVKKTQLNKKIIGIGETGLDFYYNNSKKNDQFKSFRKHIEASIDLNVPLIVHSRDAEKETYDILNQYDNENLKILMHCYTGSYEFAEKLLKFNSFFSASGIITFENSRELQETFKKLPLEKILIETDSPFLSPVPMRGKKNEPSYIKYTLQKLANLKDITDKKLDIITSQNFNNLFFS